MNKILTLVLTLIASTQFTLAQSVSAKITALNCSAYAANGATTINNVMTTANGSFVTISNVPVFGFPFIQQAKIVDGAKIGALLLWFGSFFGDWDLMMAACCCLNYPVQVDLLVLQLNPKHYPSLSSKKVINLSLH